MKKSIFITVSILMGSAFVWAQEAPNGLEPKSFEINKGQAEVKIMWGSNMLNYQLIYKKIPRRLTFYLNGSMAQPVGRLATIFFLDKDGFTVTERTCHSEDFSYGQDGRNLICRNSTEGNDSSFNADGYRKISGVSVSVNPFAAP